MSAHVDLIGRTAKILKPYAVTQKTGRNGAFESRMVMFSIATDRDYTQAVTHEDGTVTQERATDFYACRATGPIADTFAKYCSATKKDENGNDKLVSRRLAIRGHLEKYSATREETIQFTDNGVVKQLAVKLPEEREILVVESIEFLDANPVKQNGNGVIPTATVIEATAVANNATVAMPASAQPMPNIPVVQTVNAEVAPL